MRNPWSSRVALIAAVVLPVGVAAALVPFRVHLDHAVIALALVAAVVAVAATGGRIPGLLAAVSAAGSFDFFHTRPYNSFSITQRADVESAILLLVVGLMVGELSSRSTRHR